MKAGYADSFLKIYHETLEPEFCEQVIEKFCQDDRKIPGELGAGRFQRIDISHKRSTDLNISPFEDWKEYDSVFYDCLHEYLNFYTQDVPEFNFEELDDTGYQIQETLPGPVGYKWHDDQVNGGRRVLTFIWYLNDVEEEGWTEFCDGTRVKPETGKLIFFPATWTFRHMGHPPKNGAKYIVTGWVHNARK